MVQIEQLGKAIAQMLFNRRSGNGGKNPELAESVYHSLKLDPAFLLTASPAAIRLHLDQDDGYGLARMELAAKTLIEESYLCASSADVRREKARELLEYIQRNDTTFSLERVVLLEELEKLEKE